MKNVKILQSLSSLLIVGSVSALALTSCTHTNQPAQAAPSEHPSEPAEHPSEHPGR